MQVYSSFSQSKFVCMKEECSCAPVLVKVSLSVWWNSAAVLQF